MSKYNYAIAVPASILRDSNLQLSTRVVAIAIYNAATLAESEKRPVNISAKFLSTFLNCHFVMICAALLELQNAGYIKLSKDCSEDVAVSEIFWEGWNESF